MILNRRIEEYNILLGSKSPRRHELLAGCGIDFTPVTDIDVEEIYPEGLEPEKVPEYLANLKSEGYTPRLGTKDILITADTVVICEDEILGKPIDHNDALRILQRLSGRKHRVVTGVVLRMAEKRVAFSARSDVWFREITPEEAEFYINRCRPYDKAGAYGIQEWIGYIAIERIEGSFYNVMGLPTGQLYEYLKLLTD